VAWSAGRDDGGACETHSLEMMGWHVAQSTGRDDSGGCGTHSLEMTGGTWHSQLAGTTMEDT
jgi:hypothetical protein